MVRGSWRDLVGVLTIVALAAWFLQGPPAQPEPSPEQGDSRFEWQREGPLAGKVELKLSVVGQPKLLEDVVLRLELSNRRNTPLVFPGDRVEIEFGLFQAAVEPTQKRRIEGLANITVMPRTKVAVNLPIGALGIREPFGLLHARARARFEGWPGARRPFWILVSPDIQIPAGEHQFVSTPPRLRVDLAVVGKAGRFEDTLLHLKITNTSAAPYPLDPGDATVRFSSYKLEPTLRRIVDAQRVVLAPTASAEWTLRVKALGDLSQFASRYGRQPIAVSATLKDPLGPRLQGRMSVSDYTSPQVILD